MTQSNTELLLLLLPSPPTPRYEAADARKTLVQDLHLLKTKLFMDTIQAGKVPLRPGVLRIVDEAIKAGVPLGVCSTSNDKAVTTLVKVLMGEERASKFQVNRQSSLVGVGRP